MNCQKFEDYLSDRLDLKTFQIHMESCEMCRKSFQVDSQIIARSKQLNEDLIVPDLWPSIQGSIQKKRAANIHFFPIKELIYVAAASLLIVTTLIILKPYFMEETSTRILSEQALEKVKKAESNYMKAIDALESLAYMQLEDRSEPLVQLYRNKLSLIDHQIQNCRNALESNPANSHIRKYLMAALQDKHETLEEILRVNG
jgi:hypothetical protein